MPGTIAGTHTVGLNLASYSDPVTVVAGGAVSGAAWALYGKGGASTPWSITNYGFLSGHYYGIELKSNGLVTNAGTVSGGTRDGVILVAGGSVANLNTGTISGSRDGIRLVAGGTVINAGLISSVGGDGIYLAASGTVANSGTISGHNAAIDFNRGFGGLLIVDAGAVFNGVVDGGNLAGSGIVSTLEFASGAAAGTITGLGIQFRNFAQTTIDVGARWLLDGANTLVAGSTLSNGGTLDVQGGTFTNAGTIIGGTVGAMSFGVSYTNRLIVDPGAVFEGAVSGGNTIGAAAVSTLELAAGPAAGTISGLGSHFIDFAQTTIDAGAQWVVGGTLVSGASLLNAGTLSVRGGSLADAGTITGSGTVEISAGGILDITGGIAATQSVQVDAGGLLQMGSAITNDGSISGSKFGVSLAAGGTITNLGSGVITGGGKLLRRSICRHLRARRGDGDQRRHYLQYRPQRRPGGNHLHRRHHR